ncbi:MAG: hypothetical protein VB118_09535 [Oscillospiraceae bacterium]|nr:hypothetical protein [Oscillospiraceae bacterium]
MDCEKIIKKNSKLIIGAALIGQAFVCFVMFLAFMKKNKGLSGAFFSLGLLGGLSGAWMLYNEYKAIELEKSNYDCSCDCECDCDECNDDECLDKSDLFDEEDSSDIDCSIESEDDK